MLEIAKQLGLVFDLMDWAIREGLFTKDEIDEDDSNFCKWMETFEHADAISLVLNYEAAYWVLRHAPGRWGKQADFFINNRNKFINEYREKTGYQINGNSDILYESSSYQIKVALK